MSPTPTPSSLFLRLLRPALAACLWMVGEQVAFSQSAGDYRTRDNVTGDWNGTATWQEYDGADWNDVSTNPTSSDGVITVRNGAAVTVTAGGFDIDQVVVEAGATVTQSTTGALTVQDGPGTDLLLQGTWRHTSSSTSNPLPRANSGVLIQVDDGGLFEHGISASGGWIPFCTWHANSTLRFTNTGGGSVTNAVDQTFGNMEFTGAAACSMSNSISAGSFTIQGDLVFSSSGTVVFHSNNADLTATVGGDFILNGSGTFLMDNSTFSPFGTLTKRIIVGGDFLLSSGTFDFTSTNPGGARNFLVDVAGDFLHTGGTLTQSHPNVANNISLVTLNGTSGTQEIESPGQTRVRFEVGGAGAQCVVAAGKTFVGSSGTLGSNGFRISNGAANPDLVIEGTFLNQYNSGVGIDPVGTCSVPAGGTYIHNSASAIAGLLGNTTLDPASNFIYRYSGTTVASSFTGRTYGNLRFESVVAGPYNPTFGTGASALTVNGTLTVGDGAFPVNLDQGSFTGTLNFNGDITISEDATLSCRSFTLGGANTLTMVNAASNSLSASEASVTFTLNGTVEVFNTNGFGAGADHAISDADAPTIALGAASTVEFIGAAAQSAAGLPATAGNILVDNAAGVTLGNSTTLSGNLTVANGTLDLGAFTLDRASAGGTLSLAPGTTLRIGGTGTFPLNYATNDLDFTSTTVYDGTDQSVRGLIYGHLALEGAGTKTMANNANASTNDLSVDAATTLELRNERLLSVFGDQVTLDGPVTPNTGELELLSFDPTTLSTTGTVDLYNLTVVTSSGTTVSGNFGIHGTLLLGSGDFDATGAAVTLRSTVNGTGRLGPVDASADYLGDLTTERRIPGGATNWRLLGSAVDGETVEQWKDDFLTAGFPGSRYPNFSDPPGSGNLWPSVRWYDETVASTDMNDGLVGVGSAAQALARGQGFAVWSGDSLGGTQPFTVDVTGAPHIAKTAVELPMSFTSSGDVDADGWNLVSNPLPSPIDFAQISRGTDVENIYYVYNPANGNNAVWDGDLSIGTNGANGVVQSSQGFWLKANGGNVTTTVLESAKVEGNDGGLFGGSREALPLLRLRISSALNTYSDEAVVVFQDGTPAYEAGDVAQFIFGHPSAPQIATRSSDGTDLSINMYGAYGQAISIPVLVRAPITGGYRVTATELTALGNLSCLSIEDLVTGTITPLTEGAHYTFTINANDDVNRPRLLVHATAPLPFEAQDAACHAADNGRAEVTITAGPLDVTWTDALGNTLAQYPGSNGAVAITGLAPGTYAVRVEGHTGCGALARDFTIGEPDALEAASSTSDATCPNTTDGLASVDVLGGIEPYTYAWSNGGTTAAIMAVAGTYDVTITDANGCTLEVRGLTIGSGAGPTAFFEMENTTAIAGRAIVFVNMGDTGESVHWDFGDGSTSTDATGRHTYTLPGTYTVTLTVFAAGCSDSFSLNVDVQTSTGITGGGKVTVLNVWTDGQRFLVDLPFTDGRNVSIDVLDATGRLHIQRQVPGFQGRVTIPAEGLATGVWFVRVTGGDEQRTFRVPIVR